MADRSRIVISDEEIALQDDYARRVLEIQDSRMGHTRTYFIRTYGCQMNEHDSEQLAGYLVDMGYSATDDISKADLIVFNTCCVRDGAEQKVYGHLGVLKRYMAQNPNLIICVCGCMMQQEEAAKTVRARYPHVRVIFGTHNLYKFPQLVYESITGNRRIFELENNPEGHIAKSPPVVRESGIVAYTTIMYGCNNFCSYCIVPYVRGRERSRDIEDIMRELYSLKESGAKEVMLLGQNVNSYGKDIQGASFADLIKKVDEVGIDRVRFMTSHPKDLSDEVLDVMAGSKHIAHHLHLPVQSGSNRVLEAMNRHYTVDKYLGIIERAKKLMPDIGITTDIIVGFPGETEKEYEETLDLIRTVGYDSAFTFKYSPRKGTPAASMPDQISEEEKTRRITKLIKVQDEITFRIHESLVGTTQKVLTLGKSKHDEGALSGKLERGITINFDGSESLIGEFADVKITKAKHNTLYGAVIDN